MLSQLSLSNSAFGTGKPVRSRLLAGSALLALTICCSLFGQTKRTLYLFNNELPSPNGGFTVGPGNVLYGTTYNGGPNGAGTVFSLSPPATSGGKWTETELYAFGGSGDAAGPISGVVLGSNGVLYGTTYTGGAKYLGAVFSLTPPSTPGGVWTESVLYSFAGYAAKDGEAPWAGVIVGPNGALYGTTLFGGSEGNGIVYQLTPPATSGGSWTETILFSFPTEYGFGPPYPYAGLTLVKGPVLYGATFNQGGDGEGTIFQLTPPASGSGPWNQTQLYFFRGNNFGTMDGIGPYSTLALGDEGKLYGTTLYGGTGTACPNGCGTVFSFELANNNETVLYNFTGGADGSSPMGKLAIGKGGVLYGSTSGGGAGGGTIYSLTPAAGGAWTWQLLYSFNGTNDGNWPSPVTVSGKGSLFGTTYGNPSSAFELIP